MSSTTDLEAFDRDLVRTLRAKADQIVVHDRPFRPEAGPATIRLGVHRPRRSGRLLAAAAVVVLVAGAAVVQRMDDRRNLTPLSSSADTTAMANKDGVVSFMPERLSDGWALKDVTAGRNSVLDAPEVWQLFGEEATAAPSRRVLVGSVAAVPQPGLIDAPTHTIHGRPAEVGPMIWAFAPAGTIEATWLEGDILHHAIAMGEPEAGLVAFLESLAPRDDPATGFTTPAGGHVTELDAVTVDERYNSGATYNGPGGERLQVTTQSPDYYGNLLNRLAGEPGAGGFVLRGNGKGHPIASVTRDDGWTVEILSVSSVAPEAGVVEDLLDSLRPVTPQQFLDIGLAEPLTVTGMVGGWRVDVHGTASAQVVMCLTPMAGDPACNVADDWMDIDVAGGSVVIDDQWILVVVSDDTFDPTATADPHRVPGAPEHPAPELLDPERVQVGDQVIEIFTIPADVQTVGVEVPIPEGLAIGEDQMTAERMGTDYERPQG